MDLQYIQKRIRPSFRKKWDLCGILLHLVLLVFSLSASESAWAARKKKLTPPTAVTEKTSTPQTPIQEASVTAPDSTASFPPPRNLKWSLGLLAGEPVGISARFWAAERWAAAFNMGYSFLNQARVWVDLLYHLPVGSRMWFVLGLGGRFFFQTGTFDAHGIGSALGITARLPLAWEIRLGQTPFRLGIMLSPSLNITPRILFSPEGQLTLQWVFEPI